MDKRYINTIVLYCIVLHCIALYCIVLYCIVLYCIVLYCIVLYCIGAIKEKALSPYELRLHLGTESNNLFEKRSERGGL